VERLYDEYQFPAAFAVASLLMATALITLIAKKLIKVPSQKRQPSEAS
jgi:ABC-type sulfate transport system permease subunit